mgnify:FL=1|jgi:hypothetical protein
MTNIARNPINGQVDPEDASVLLANISADLAKVREAVYRDNGLDMDCKDRALSAIDAAFRDLDRAYSYLEE